MGNSYFEFKKFTIHQDKCAFKVTTDACILGGYVELSTPKKICDIGTGTGILALMMAQKFPGALIEAVEYDPASAKQAEENIKSSPWKERMIVFNNRIQDYAVNIKNKYDLIICNPPYYEDHLKSASYKKNLAKHDHKLSLTELSEIIPVLLKNSGYFYTILPPFSFKKFNADMINKGYRLQDKLEIYNDHSKSLYRILGGFGKMPVQMKKKTLVIYDDTGQYTNEYKILLKDYYLAF